MLQNMSSGHRLVLFLVAFGVGVVSTAAFFSPLIATGVAIFFCVVLWLLRGALMPPGYGANKVRTLALTLSAAIVASYPFWHQLLDGLVSVFAKSPEVLRRVPWLASVELAQAPSIVTLAFFLAVVWIVNHYMADRSIAGKQPDLDVDFPEIGFHQKLASFCDALRQHLVQTDREANWSPEYYADLEAEVEIMPGSGLKERRQIVDLQTALRSDKQSKAFLVLGDPGSGKSVALRKLARDMLSEVDRTGRVPIYVNLREWLPASGRGAWLETNKPSLQEFEAFVVANVKARGDVFTEDFVDGYFRKLWEHGRLFFLLDSFDEIPELLDVDEASWLIDALSDLLFRFIATGTNSRGLLASRVFRKPTFAFVAQKTLEIRPLSEDKVERALHRFPTFTTSLRLQLFRDRQDLVAVARNPLLMALLGEWVDDHGSLPAAQADLYENYLRKRLAKCATRIASFGLTEQQILEGATKIAVFVFDSPEYGLEAPVKVIGAQAHLASAFDVLEVLRHARIGRVTQGDNKSFAFVHRRFLEYLVTTSLLQGGRELPIDHIPTDSRGRDAMVLYAQVCGHAEAGQLALTCWNEVQLHFHDPVTRMRGVHSLRFLIDAFRSRRNIVATFADDLAAFIKEYVEEGQNLVLAKICLESTGLLPQERALPILGAAMLGSNQWLQETAFRACRNQPRIDPQLQGAIANYLDSIPPIQLSRNYRSLQFSLSLSDAMRPCQHHLVWRYRNLIASLAALAVATVAVPAVTLLGLTYGVFLWSIMMVASMLDESRSIRRFGKSQSEFSRRHWLLDPFLVIRTAASLIFVGIVLVLMIRPIGFEVGYILLWPLVELSPWALPIALSLLALALIDWKWLRMAADVGARWLRGKLTRSDAVMVGSAVVIGLGFWLIVGVALPLLVRFEPLQYAWIALAGLGLVMAVKGGLRMLTLHREDWRRFKSASLSPRMSREEIVRDLTGLRTSLWRLRLVRRLAELRTEAHGDWPPGFELAVGTDPALTELARLEERWLKLDR